MAHYLISVQFQRRSFASGGFCQTVEKIAISIASMGSFLDYNDFIALRGPSPIAFIHCQEFLRNLSMSLHNRWRIA
jgi:hypothetical protein